ncbi:MAG: 50S ribosomal protein L3 N(5)-glutamine methyltransferase [Gammaproteobacteria bacterium]|nr:50S ribosomal protein L3 N(5)-glutamine methyltransferase [Gammaproteobacteria bacterium]
MNRLSHTSGARRVGPVAAPATTLGALLARSTRRLARARLCYGHGTDNPHDDAAAILWHVLALPPGAVRPARRVSAAQVAAVDALVQRRIAERIPVVYLTGSGWFAGLRFHVDPRVLVPRSAIAELIERRFVPWIDPRRVRRILDLGTGSGCIACAAARAFPRARVDASDISPAALAVAELNIRRLRLGRRVRAVQADHFRGLGRARYDIIVSNPPYVGQSEMRRLPPEYRHEPALALAAGRTGLDSVRAILAGAARHLQPGGLLVVEVGNTEAAVRRAWPAVPFTWLEFTRGGGGVFVLTRAQLRRGAARRGGRGKRSTHVR